MTDTEEDRRWPQDIGLTVAAVWASVRAVGGSQPPLIRLGLGIGAFCALIALAWPLVARVRAAARGRKASAVETGTVERRDP